MTRNQRFRSKIFHADALAKKNNIQAIDREATTSAGSSGAGTTSVKQTFETIFRREHITAAFIEGDAFHRYDRAEMERAMAEAEKRGNSHFSHFGLEAGAAVRIAMA